MRWLRMAVQAMAALCLAQACTKSPGRPETPEGTLEAYVKTAFSVSSLEVSRKLLDLSTGEARDWLESMSKETFEQQFMRNKMVLQSFTTKDLRQEKNGDVSLVYEIAFKDGSHDGKPTNEAVYTNKKIAYLHKDGEQWKIKATKNVKTYIERKDALEIPPNPPGYVDPEAPKAETHGK